MHDATEITDPDEEWEDREVQDPWWQRVVFDEYGDVDWIQTPRFAHWEDWRWWVRRRRPWDIYLRPEEEAGLGFRIWIQGTRLPV